MGLQSFLVNFTQLADAPNAIARLRELILQLAVEGKLVHQDDREESAFQLIERIEAEKVRLANEKGFKASQPIPVTDKEFPYVLPNGWLWSRLMNLGLINPRNNFDDSATASFVPMNLIPQKYGESVKTETRYWGDIKRGFTHFAEGDVVLAKITPCFQNGKAAVMQGLENNVGAGTTELHVFRPIDGSVCPEYVLAYLKSPKFLMEGIPHMTGTAGQKRVPNDYFAQNPFPLPPLAEQRRIVVKVDELMRLCDQLEARQLAKRESRVRLNTAILAPLNKAASLMPEEFEQAATRLADNFETLYDSIDTISKLRATILQVAVQGRLVPQDPNDEAAETLVRKIEIDREATAKNKKVKLKKIPIAESAKLNMAIPSSWQYEALGNLVEAERSISYGVLVPGQDTADGIPFVRLQDLDIYYPPPKPSKSISSEIEKQYSRTRLIGGEILLGVVGSIGKLGVAPAEWAGANIARAVSRIAPHSLVNRDYLVIALRSPAIQSYFLEATRTLAQPTLNVSLIELTQVPLPPLAEQKRIVAKVNQLMSLCDELEAKQRQTEADSEKLMDAAVKHVLDDVRDVFKTAEEVFA